MKLKDIALESWAIRWPHVRLDQFDEVKDSHGDTRSDSLNNMDDYAMDMFERMVRYAYDNLGWKHIINSGYREGDKGRHGEGIAIDVVFYRKKPGDIPVLEQWSMALRFNWGGIGFYPFWNTPGLHVDMRTVSVRAMWYRAKDGTMGQVSEYFASL